jgi:hypothetical protein
VLSRDVSLTVKMNPDTYDLLVKWDWVGGRHRAGSSARWRPAARGRHEGGRAFGQALMSKSDREAHAIRPLTGLIRKKWCLGPEARMFPRSGTSIGAGIP